MKNEAYSLSPMTEADITDAQEHFYKAIRRHCNPPEEEWIFYRSNMIPRIIKKGNFLLKPGEPSNIYAFINKGIMKQYFLTHDGREFITRFDFPKETSGDAATLWKRIPARQYIQAITDVHALVATPDLLYKLRDRHPVWQEGSRSLAEFRFFEKCDREYELLSYDAETRYNLFRHRYEIHIESIPQKDIANYIGVTASSLNKILKKL